MNAEERIHDLKIMEDSTMNLEIPDEYVQSLAEKYFKKGCDCYRGMFFEDQDHFRVCDCVFRNLGSI